ncbi:TrmB family transcriptional regulator [Halorussus sp. MSC15.2]|uniref:TrmB family transcriptional regulator n=1 Tax=Halorussus sp. MSC15.2 TaxID=2283638 RepID=UPI001F072693|nr:helix-turn-helix domain-containing protein [Halorussus sp. MSC15.2]
MVETDRQTRAARLLQQLGLKEYEAKCFVVLTRKGTATAKQISEITDVPRTRVYDAIRVSEAQGLVEIQHTNPRQYRAVPLEEATRTPVGSTSPAWTNCRGFSTTSNRRTRATAR